MKKKINVVGTVESLVGAVEQFKGLGFNCSYSKIKAVDESDKDSLLLFELVVEDNYGLDIPTKMTTVKEFRSLLVDLKNDYDDNIMSDKIISELKKLDEKNFDVDLPYNYDEYISIDDIKKYKTYDDFIDAAACDLYECNIQYIGELIDNNLTSNLAKLDLTDAYDNLGFDYQERVKEWHSDNCNVDVLSDLLSHSREFKANIFPYQDENLNCEGGELREAISDLSKKLSGEKDIVIKNELLEKLFASQGYDVNKVTGEEDSEFIKSFKSEINNIWEYYPMFFTCLTKLSLEDYFKLIRGELELKFKGMCGLFDFINGAGSSLEVKLEKPFIIKFTGEEEFDAIQIEEIEDNCGYTVNEVCGLCGSAWEHSDYNN